VLYAGEYDVMLGKIFRAMRFGWESLRLEVMNYPYTRTQTHTKRENALKHCLETTSEPQSDLPNHNQTFMIKNTHRLGLQTFVAHQTLLKHTTQLRFTLEALMEPPPSVIWTLWQSSVRTKQAGQQKVMLQLTLTQLAPHKYHQSRNYRCLSFRLSHSGHSRDSSKRDFDLYWVNSDLFLEYNVSTFPCLFFLHTKWFNFVSFRDGFHLIFKLHWAILVPHGYNKIIM